MSGRILVVDDDPAMCNMLRTHLERRAYAVTALGTAREAFELLRTQDFDVVVTDLKMREMNGIELCERVVGDRPDIPVVVITAFGSLEAAIATIRVGAYDFLPKPFEIDVLVLALERAIQHRRLRAEVTRLQHVVASSKPFGGEIVGDSDVMREVFVFLERFKDSSAPVLIGGESGTGKELVARALHHRARPDGPFVAFNCAAMPENLFESALFGHARGAFTDARSARDGLFVLANGGTLFLDEIGELPLALQPKLLRALQERVVQPLGSGAEVPFDARIISATNRDVESEVAERRFREDLYYRLDVLHLDLPPLRARGNDVLLLAQQFVTKSAAEAGKRLVGISSAAAEKLLGYAWPGNVRELQNCIERAVALAQYAEIVVEDLPEKIRSYTRTRLVLATDDPGDLAPMHEIEQRYILRVLEAVGGNRTAAARILGFDRTTLYRKLVRYGLADDDRKGD